MKKIIAILVICAAIFTMAMRPTATTYYVSATGSDSNNGTSSGTPWQTIGKVNSSTFASGDIIQFKGGETFYGSITCPRSTITITSYGTGKATLTGFTTITDFASPVSGVYTSNSAVSTLSTCNIISVAGVNYAKGRQPKTGYYTIGTGATNGSTTITDATNISTSKVSTGADCVIRELMFEVNNRVISGVSGSTATFASGEPKVGWGYFLQNDIKLCTQANEWYYNIGTKKLGIYATSAPTVKVPTLETGINLNGKSNITISNLNITGFNTSGILADYGNTITSNLTVSNCDFSFIGVNAIDLYGDPNVIPHGNTPNPTITGSTFTDIGSRGIWAASSDNAVITGNTLTRVGHFAGMGSNGDDSYTGVIANGDGSLVQNNSITDAGYCGIRADGNGTTVKGNVITNYCYIKDDGGGVYMYQVNAGNTQYDWATARTVRDNVILNGIGNKEGVPTSINGNTRQCGSVYLDGRSSDVRVIHNTLNFAQYGVFHNGGKDVFIDSNNVYDCSRGIYSINIGQPLTGLTVTNNRLVAKAGQYAAYFEPGANIMPSDFTSNNNCFARPIDETTTIWYDSLANNKYVTLAKWKAVAFSRSQDNGSVTGIKPITASTDLAMVYNATGSNKTSSLPGVWADIKTAQTYTNSVPLAAYSSVILIKISDVPLPIKVRGLKFIKSPTVFQWESTDEENLAYWVIEESTNGTAWTETILVPASGPKVYNVPLALLGSKPLLFDPTEDYIGEPVSDSSLLKYIKP